MYNGREAMTTPERITVWTVQKVDLDLAQPGVEYDYRRGDYWNGCLPVDQRYREVLPILHRHFGVNQILWCLSNLVGWEMFVYRDDVAWEIEMPTGSVLALFDGMAWGRVIAGEALDMSKICLPRYFPVTTKCEVLVRWPLGRDCRITKLGSLKYDGTIDEPFLSRIREKSASAQV
jgi:hypothetical protein